MRISDWSSDVCSSDLLTQRRPGKGDRGIGQYPPRIVPPVVGRAGAGDEQLGRVEPREAVHELVLDRLEFSADLHEVAAESDGRRVGREYGSSVRFRGTQ